MWEYAHSAIRAWLQSYAVSIEILSPLRYIFASCGKVIFDLVTAGRATPVAGGLAAPPPPPPYAAPSDASQRRWRTAHRAAAAASRWNPALGTHPGIRMLKD